MMPIEAVKIPQNVQIEDRVIGPISLRQIILMLIGGGISYMIFSVVSQTGTTSLVPKVLSWIPLFITVLFAFIKVHDVSLLRMCLLMVERSIKSPTRVYGPRKGINIVNIKLLGGKRKKDKIDVKPISELDALTKALDHPELEAELATLAENQ